MGAVYSNFVQNTLSSVYRKIRQTNSDDASYPSRPNIKAFLGSDNTPSGKGNDSAQTTRAIIELAKIHGVPNTTRIDSSEQAVGNILKFLFFGTGNDGDTFKARVLGWRYTVDRDADMNKNTAMWINETLAEVTVTLSALVGVAGCVVDENQRFADTIEVVGTSGVSGQGFEIVSPADDTAAHLKVDAEGAQLVEVIFDRNGQATSCNGLYAIY